MAMRIGVFIVIVRPGVFTIYIFRMGFYRIKMMMMRNNSMGKNNYACDEDKKFACMFSFYYQTIRDLKCFLNLQRQIYNKVHATGLQSYFLQFEQTPLTTIFTLSRAKLLGRFIVGTGMSFKQNV